MPEFKGRVVERHQLDSLAQDGKNPSMERAGAFRAQLSRTLSAAYGRGLLSEHTLAMRLDSLMRQHVVDAEQLVGDLSLRGRASARERLSHTMSTVRGRIGTLRTEEPMPTLLALDWSGGSSELLIGRSSSCDIVLSDIGISRRHARLRFRDGIWTLEDLGSTNGSKLNGRPVRRCELRPGDDLRIGSTFLRID